MTKSICEVRDAFSKVWHSKIYVWSQLEHCGFADADRYLAFCTAKDWLQDTGEALYLHRQKGFDPCEMIAYIEFWGILQATFIQQDAISELNYAVCGKRLIQNEQPEAWKAMRNYRNLWVGHPNCKSNGEPQGCVVRSVTGREPKSYEAISIHYNSGRDQRHETVNLGSLIDEYEKVAIKRLGHLFSSIEKKLFSDSEKEI